MNNRAPVFILLVAFLILGSCTKQNSTPTPTRFTIYCQDELNNPLPGVIINIFKDSVDWASVSNIAYTAKTNDSGRVSFSGIPSAVYYFQCLDTANCYRNYNGYFTANAIPLNQLTNITIVLTGYGKIALVNKSSNREPYEIKLNGKVWSPSLAYGDSISETIPAGPCALEAIQLKGFINAPSDVTYGLTINQCSTTVQDIQ